MGRRSVTGWWPRRVVEDTVVRMTHEGLLRLVAAAAADARAPGPIPGCTVGKAARNARALLRIASAEALRRLREPAAEAWARGFLDAAGASALEEGEVVVSASCGL
jgi:hypothetical protein